MKKIFPLLLVFISFAIIITGCGRRGSPEPIEKTGYPRKYPIPT